MRIKCAHARENVSMLAPTSYNTTFLYSKRGLLVFFNTKHIEGNRVRKLHLSVCVIAEAYLRFSLFSNAKIMFPSRLYSVQCQNMCEMRI